ncbi:MAG: HAD-IC family P-type ATPase [Rhodovarius sp.]|nr:HAD-IC family P-type ATPase [Rhodovarius sp.]
MDHPPPPPHALPAEAVLAQLGSSAGGLDPAEAAARLARHGPNRLPEGPRRGPLARFLGQFRDLLIHVLLVAAALSLLLGHPLDAAVILGVVLINAAIGFVQEGRAAQALEAIRALIDPTATVLRGGRRQRIPAAAVVPGDVVLLEPGDRVPADLRLLRVRALRIDESALTGESVPVEKNEAPTAPETPLAERACMAWSGTLVAAGQGAGVVVATGAATELGRISTLLREVETLETPLLRQMAQFARQISAAVLAVAVAVFAFAVLLRGLEPAAAFMAVVGLSVAAIPEGLPAVLTITLAIGVRRMAARNAIIRQLPAVETLGAVAVICTDKTGTLTRNEMMAAAIRTAAGAVTVGGAGYAPVGELRRADGSPADPARDPLLAPLLRCAVLCNDAELVAEGEDWRVEGDPMEGALLVLARKAGLDPQALRAAEPRRDEIPFDAAHRYMATLHGGRILLKGAPEAILALCGAEATPAGLQPLHPARWADAVEEMAAAGQRVLAFAELPLAGEAERIDPRLLHSAVLLGLIGFIDPPRPEAAAAVADARAAGIRVVMITGDHAATAREIARQLGLDPDPQVLTGAELDAMDEAALRAAARRVTVFARTTPEHKLRLVMALQAEGLLVAMTGDGVNDAPALKRADVGVAMGRRGTEAAKQAADMVLADDNFASIVAAVREGRTVYDNLRKVIAWTLPTNGGEALTIIAAILAGLPLPITPLQILWVNMVTAVALGLTLAFEPTEPGTMRRPPRPPREPILTAELIWRVLFTSCLMAAGAFGLYFWAEARGLPQQAAYTIVVNAIVAMEIAYLFSIRYALGSSLTWQGVRGTPALLIGLAGVTLAQIALTWAPPLQLAFATASLGLLDLAGVVAVAVMLFLLVEAEKRIRLGARIPSRPGREERPHARP